MKHITFRMAGPERALWLPLLAILLVSLSGLPLVACGASVTHKPAAKLRLLIDINHTQTENGPPSHYIGASFVESDTGNPVVPPHGATLTCNGVAMGQCPQQPPGGSYQITYTDEHGAATTVGVPVPEVAFAILSPVAGGTATIPTNGLLPIRFAAPRFPPTWTVAVDRASAQCGAQAQTWQCAVEADEHGSVVPPPARANTRPRSISATPRPPATPVPNSTPTPFPATATPDAIFTPSPSSVRVVLNGSESTALLRGDFSRWEPGPGGRVALSLRAEGNVQPSGFQMVTVRVSEFHAVPVTWVCD